MQSTSLAIQTVFAELVQRCLDAEFDETFDERGSFIRKTVKGKDYIYYQRKVGAEVQRRYVGPASDPEVSERVSRFGSVKSDYKQRREMVRALLAAGLPASDPMSGAVVASLQRAGFFRLRGILVGTLAFQTYSGALGVRLPLAVLQTGDADFAQFHDVSRNVEDTVPPILDILRAVDPTFTSVPNSLDRARVAKFRTGQGYLVEFLTPNRGSEDHMGRPAAMPALGGASATPLRFLDYLIREPQRSVMLYDGGVSVTVPSPSRYAIHKLIISRRRKTEKVNKDVAQAAALIDVLAARHPFDLREAFDEAVGRGDAWKKLLLEGLAHVPSATRDKLLMTIEETRSTIPGVALRFENDRAMHDAERDVIRFFGSDRSHEVSCAISAEALEDHFGAKGNSRKDLLEAFRRHRDNIQKLAQTKYLRARVELGEVILRSTEIDQL